MDESVRKEIIFRGSRRGLKEMDLILNPFVNNCLNDLSNVEVEQLRALLAETDGDLLNWFSNKQYPAKYAQIMTKIVQ